MFAPGMQLLGARVLKSQDGQVKVCGYHEENYVMGSFFGKGWTYGKLWLHCATFGSRWRNCHRMTGWFCKMTCFYYSMEKGIFFILEIVIHYFFSRAIFVIMRVLGVSNRMLFGSMHGTTCMHCMSIMHSLPVPLHATSNVFETKSARPALRTPSS